MSSLRVLFLGGTGTISTACVRAAVAAGHDVSVLNRGNRDRDLPDGVRRITGDVRDADAVRAAVGEGVDVVADFLSFVPEHVETVL
ncbi:NAD-dependent epimerase/dehydratase family protein, partial [Microbacterium sp. zg.Y909]|uniref:NAD-dependent epimerase/dehydratase family protein n=1 Tax=Microbacterium sp. zg.Y909 TaxID=2969413 RepID=UPI00214CE1D8